MLDILIVDDDDRKVAALKAVIEDACGVGGVRILRVSDGVSARRLLMDSRFGLVIVDLLLPDMAGSEPSTGAGERLISDLFRKPGYKVPLSIVAISAHESEIRVRSDACAANGVAVLHYSTAASAWAVQLAARARHALAISHDIVTTPPSDGAFCAVLCALEDPELIALLDAGWEWQQVRFANDNTIYYRTNVDSEWGQRTVYAASLQRMGMATAAAAAMKMICSLKPAYIAMVGIAAGVKGRVELGDVIVADPTWDYGSGKWKESNGVRTFDVEPYQFSTSPLVRNAVRALSRDRKTVTDLHASWMGASPSRGYKIHIGPVASGAAVLADGEVVKNVIRQHRKLLGIEMEAFGVYAAADDAPEPRPTPIAIKGVSDFADGAKCDDAQPFAAHISAVTLMHLVQCCLPS